MIVVERFAYTPVGTFGRMFLPSGAIIFTCEDPDNANKNGVSCIPEGEYLCLPSIYHKHNYPAYEITGVKNRSRILIHKGNSDEDVEGCIIVGMKWPEWFGVPKGLGIGNSAGAFGKFMKEMNGEKFTLQIRPYTPTREIRNGWSLVRDNLGV